ncbi:hypothetical protein ACSFCX_00005, partial [Yokenella regensburgei]|uniref:hypothetical protein n=1 Tax=Yokenella regensburgei TaxID=158877 RepID=UPI003EDA2F80
LCESVDEPPAEQPWHIFSEVVITPPSIVWVKTFTPGNNLVVTTMSSPAPSTLQEDSMQLEVDGLLPEETRPPTADGN